jgi:hypothetical protein
MSKELDTILDKMRENVVRKYSDKFKKDKETEEYHKAGIEATSKKISEMLKKAELKAKPMKRTSK